MEPLTFKDTQTLNQSIQKLYSLRNLNTFGVDALTIVNQLVHGEIPTFHSTCIRSRQIIYTFLNGFLGFTAEMKRVRLQHYGEHPITQHMLQTFNGTYKISDFINSKEFHYLEGLYQQFFRLLDVEDQIIFFLPNFNSFHNLAQTDITVVGVALHRFQRNFTERDRLILDLLRPHLFQAYCNAQHCQQLQQNLSQLQQSLKSIGLVTLNTKGQVQWITPQATAWLEIYFPKLTASLQLPNLVWSWVKHQVKVFTQEPDLPKACLPWRIQHADKQLVIRLVVEQNAEQYLLLLEEQTLSLLKLLELLRLSQRETEVLFWVIQGKDNKAIAKQLDVHISTVRKHLESIYRKLGVQSRTEAIAQALEKLGVLNSLLLNRPLAD